ncbi:MAG: hypothetical protein ABSH53_23500 [Holophaga sp.]
MRDLRLGALARGGLKKGLSRDLERLICGYLAQDHCGQAIRARIALHAMDQKIRRSSPEAADALAAP